MSTALVIVLIVVGLVVLTAVGVVMGRGPLARYQRIRQLKRFRKSTRGGRIAFDEDDKRTISV